MRVDNSSDVVNLLRSSPSSGEKDKVNVERKGPAPARGSLTEPTPPSLPSKKCGPSVTPTLLPGIDISDGSHNSSSTMHSPECSVTDGKHAH